jgi:hypothetical protein
MCDLFPSFQREKSINTYKLQLWTAAEIPSPVPDVVDRTQRDVPYLFDESFSLCR